MTAPDRTVEDIIIWFANRQHGVVSRRQLLAAGVTSAQIAWRLREGLLLPVHRGVYRVGHRAPSVEATYLAAVFAGGDGAVLCRLAAAHAFELVRGRAPRPEVLAPRERRIAGVVTRRARGRHPAEASVWRGIPITTVPRTLVDLAAVLDAERLGRAFHEADVRFGTTPEQVEAVISRRPSAPGVHRLRAVVHGEIPVTLSVLERRFVAAVIRAGLPVPLTNRPAGGRRIDCRWPEARLTVELDSYTYHRSRHAWERDRRREREAYARGEGIRRFTHDDVMERVDAVIRELTPVITGKSPG